MTRLHLTLLCVVIGGFASCSDSGAGNALDGAVTIPDAAASGFDAAGPDASDNQGPGIETRVWWNGPWRIEIVDLDSLVGTTTSMQFDTHGTPHIAHGDATNDDLIYTYRDGDRWQREVVDTGGVGWHASMVLDKNDVPHVLHYGFASSDLRYSHKTNGTWETELVDSQGAVGRKPSAAFDSAGRLHVSYHDTGNDDLKYAVRATDGAWTVRVIDEVRDKVGDHTSLALDRSDNPHIAYYYSVDPEETVFGDLLYIHYDGAQWNREIVDATGLVGTFTSLAVGKDDLPRISYRSDSNRDLKFARKTDAGWTIQTVDARGDVGDFNTSLRLGENDVPSISYHDWTNGSLKLATFRDGSWEVEVVDDADLSGHYSSLVLDANGVPHVSYSFRDSFPAAPARPNYIGLKFASRIGQ